MSTPTNFQRRRFLQATGSGFAIACFLPLGRASAAAAADMPWKANAFVRVGSDDTVTVISKHIEFGQGPYTGLATLVAEELDADWSQIRVESSPANDAVYKNLAFGSMGTGGSSSIRNSYAQMREAGAAARAVLVEAAAQRWGVEPGAITVAGGVVSHGASGRSASFGELAMAAAALTPPDEVTLKSPDQFTLIGTEIPRLDTPAKTNGTAQFTQDIRFDGMLTAVVAHPPVFGARVKGFDDSAALKVAGVKQVFEIPQGVAVVATGTAAALAGRKALKVSWDDTEAEKRSSVELFAAYRKALDGAGMTVESVVPETPAKAAKTLEATYELPYLAHATMETLDAVIRVDADGAEAWLGSQMPTGDQKAIAGVLGLAPDKVAIHTQLAGGSFGRRAQPGSVFAAEAAAVAKGVARGTPVKLMWAREDDMTAGYYRPMSVHRISGAVDESGRPVQWRHTLATQSILAGTPFEAMMKDGVDQTMVEGARGLAYELPQREVVSHQMAVGVPVLWWRSVGHTHNGFVTETFLDRLLELGQQDPIDGRLALLPESSREAGVLRAVAAMAERAGAVPEGRARGVAVHKSFQTYVAEIAEVSRDDGKLPKVERVWCAVDCGVAVNPDIIRAQMEGGIGDALGAALFSALTLGDGGVVQQQNFDSYRLLRIDEMPAVEVEVVASAEAPTGVGEPGVPPLAPAVANAWRRLTGEAVSTLPFANRA